MGLDLMTLKHTNKHIRVGSYGYVHVLRTALIKAYIEFDDPGNPNRAEIAEWLDESGNVDYTATEAFVGEEGSVVRGLGVFVDHSDCDGFLWQDDVFVTALMLQALHPHVADPEIKKDVWDLAQYFFDASKNGESVMFV